MNLCQKYLLFNPWKFEIKILIFGRVIAISLGVVFFCHPVYRQRTSLRYGQPLSVPCWACWPWPGGHWPVNGFIITQQILNQVLSLRAVHLLRHHRGERREIRGRYLSLCPFSSIEMGTINQRRCYRLLGLGLLVGFISIDHFWKFWITKSKLAIRGLVTFDERGGGMGSEDLVTSAVMFSVVVKIVYRLYSTLIIAVSVALPV